MAFHRHFLLAQKFVLPMYFSSVDANQDFTQIIRANRDKFDRGVVRNFKGTLIELKALLALDLFLSINRDMLEAKENCEIIKNIPLDRLLIESNSDSCNKNTQKDALVNEV
jgi:TatD DNase family protein